MYTIACCYTSFLWQDKSSGLEPCENLDRSFRHANETGRDDEGIGDVQSDVWDQSRQEQWVEQFYKIALSKPFVDSVTYSCLVDTESSTIANSGLLTDRLEPKKSFHALKKLYSVIFKR